MQNKLPPGFPVKIGECNLEVSYVTGFAHQSNVTYFHIVWNLLSHEPRFCENKS